MHRIWQRKRKGNAQEMEQALLRRLTAANPYKREAFSGYAASKEGQSALARLLAADREATRSHRRPIGRRLPRPVWIGAAALLVAAAAVLLVLYVGAPAPPAPIALTSGPSLTTAPSRETPTTPALPYSVPSDRDLSRPEGVIAGIPSPPEGSVFGFAALARILELAWEATTPETAYPLSPGLSGTDRVIRDALSIGILSASEGPDYGLREPIGRRDYMIQLAIPRRLYAVWLWRAFGHLLSPTVTGVSFSDLDSLTSEERSAITGLARAGIFAGRANGTFGPNAPLLRVEEQAILARLRQLLR